MNWLVGLRTFLGHDEKPISLPNNGEISKDTIAALENAKHALEVAETRREEIQQVTKSLSSLRSRNHFGESIQYAMMSKGRKT